VAKPAIIAKSAPPPPEPKKAEPPPEPAASETTKGDGMEKKSAPHAGHKKNPTERAMDQALEHVAHAPKGGAKKPQPKPVPAPAPGKTEKPLEKSEDGDEIRLGPF
jgi:hypothetical protein